MKQRVLFSWSGGKDSAMALHEILEGRDYEIAALMTTVTECYDRISMHGVRKALLDAQAASLGLPLEIILISPQASNDEYEKKMEETLLRYREQGVFSVAFGDLFLEDLKKYREDNLRKIEMTGVFPIWMRDTAQLARDFIAAGFKAVVTCVDTQVLDGAFAGREYDEKFLSLLPAHADPCGENGEFHSFVYAGPIFRETIRVEKGEVVLRDGRFMYCDVVPA